MKTCKQFCFGYGSFYGILNMVDSTCTCAEFINIDAVYDIAPCTYESYSNGTSSYVYNTGMVIITTNIAWLPLDIFKLFLYNVILKIKSGI